MEDKEELIELGFYHRVDNHDYYCWYLDDTEWGLIIAENKIWLFFYDNMVPMCDYVSVEDTKKKLEALKVLVQTQQVGVSTP